MKILLYEYNSQHKNSTHKIKLSKVLVGYEARPIDTRIRLTVFFLFCSLNNITIVLIIIMNVINPCRFLTRFRESHESLFTYVMHMSHIRLINFNEIHWNWSPFLCPDGHELCYLGTGCWLWSAVSVCGMCLSALAGITLGPVCNAACVLVWRWREWTAARARLRGGRESWPPQCSVAWQLASCSCSLSWCYRAARVGARSRPILAAVVQYCFYIGRG